MSDDFDTQPQVEEQYDSMQEESLREMGTFASEPANEDGWDDMGMTSQQQFDILFGYAEERHMGYTYMDKEEDKYSYADGYEL